MQQSSISPKQVIHILHSKQPHACIDVRSEGEWQKAESPGFHNLPVLNNQERHEVGICYKKHGAQAAIDLGEELVTPHRQARIDAWINFAAVRPTIVACWRGGMRSGKTADILRAHGLTVQTVQGGYKAIRTVYLEYLERALPKLVVLSGLTGVNKTGLIQSCSSLSVDLEKHANHRGSTFGHYPDQSQPAQASFENSIAFDLMACKSPTILLEDESSHIGRVRLPHALREKMIKSPVIVLEADMEARVQHIFEEYIMHPLDSGQELDEIHSLAKSNLNRIERRLGGKKKKEIETAMHAAFSSPYLKAENHFDWISDLLVTYYDPMYRFGQDRNPRPTLFKGDFTSCMTWIQNHLTSV